MSGWSGWKGRGGEGGGPSVSWHSGQKFSGRGAAHLTRPGPPRSPLPGWGQSFHPAQPVAFAGSLAAVQGTYIKVDGWHPGDADGLGLAALHKALGGLDGEALVLQGRDAVQAELDSLQAVVLSAGGRAQLPGGSGAGGEGAQHLPSRP